jgi:hypothetical protein
MRPVLKMTVAVTGSAANQIARRPTSVRTILTTLIGIIFIGNTGCMGTVAKRAFSEVVGATSEADVVPGTSAAQFARYQGVNIKPLRTDLGGMVDSRFTSALPSALRQALTQAGERDKGESAVFPGGSPTLEIEPQITWYHKAGGVGGLLGSDSYAVVLFWISADGAPLGKVQIVTKTAAARTGPEDMAKSMAKELAKFFRQAHKKKNRD